MKVSTTNYEQTQNGNIFCCLFEKFKANTKFLLPLILFFGLIQGVFAQGTLQPAVNITGPLEACAKTPTSNTSGDITLSIDIARSGAGATINYFIDPLLNSSGAFIRSVGAPFYQTIDTDPLPGPDHNTINHTYQTIVVYPGTTGQGFNILVTAINNQSSPATTASASKSVSVSELVVESSYSPILCYGGLSTLTVTASLSDQNAYTFTLWDTVNDLPIGASNTDGIFGSLPGSVAGITYTVKVISAESCEEFTSQTITQPADNPVVLNCPQNLEIAACSSQAQVDAAFNTWLNSFSKSGGTNPVVIRTPSSPNAPSACGGTVEVRWDVTQLCYPTQTCSRTFTVLAPPPVVFNCGVNVIVPACSTQDQVSSAWATFLASTTASGGCSGSLTNNAPTSLPSACGANINVTWTYTVGSCGQTQSCTRNFTVTAPPAVVVGAPANSSASACTYANQDAVNTAFAAWLAQFTVSGGCNPSGNYGQVSAPNACGGLTTVTYTVTDRCYETTTRTRTFEVTPAPAVVVGAPANSSANACTYANQDAVNAAFAAWLAQFTVSGGCNPSGSFGPNTAPPTAPNACGGLTTVTYTVTDRCYETTTRTRTFEVTPAPAVVVGAPANSSANACTYANQDAVNTAFAAWLAQFTVSGGCDPSGNYGQVSAPNACGGLTTVTYTVTDKCYQTTTRTRTFEVTPAPAVVVGAPANSSANACTYANQDAVNAAFALWLAQFTVSGGCDPSGSYGQVSAPNACGGLTTVTYTVTDKCYETTTRTRTFEVTPAPAVVVGAPANSSASACTYANQDEVSNAFALWLAQFTVSGGCDPSGNYGEVSAPNACGGLTTVTYTVTDKCYETTTRTRTFEVTPAPAVVVGAPTNSSANACTYANQDAVNAAFAAWLAQFTVSGGCDPSGNYGQVSAPNACGGLTTVTYTVTDKCYETTTRTRTFEVTPAPAVVVGAPANSSTNACTYANQDAVNTAFAAWLAQFTVSGGCDPSGNYGEVSAPNACGGLTTVTYTVTDKCYETTTRTRTFEVTPAPAVVVGAPANSSANACTYANQDAVNTAFAAWLAQFTVSGGCDPSGNYGQPTAPPACGGLTTVTYTVTDKCYETTTRTRTFEVTPAPAVIINVPANSTANSNDYANQAAVDAAFAAWLAQFTVSGGCDPNGTYAPVTAPSICGGIKTVTYTVTDKCYETSSQSATFTIIGGPAVVVGAPANSSANACTYANQDEVSNAFAAWLAQFTVSGGYEPSGSYGEVSAPNACGGLTTVTYTVTDRCYETTTTIRTFEVTPAPAVVVGAPANSSANACTYANQDAVNAAFSAWLAQFTVSGGCNPSGSFGPNTAPPTAPNACGGLTTVTYTVTDKCYETTTRTRTFEVTPAPAVVVGAPTNSSASACTYANQDEVSNAFALWLAQFTVSGGCDPSGNYGEVSAPNACGGLTTVTYTVTDKCYETTTRTRTFEVTPAPAVVVGAPTNSSANACTYANQDAVNTAFALWLAQFTVSGGCDPSGNYGQVSAPNACGGLTTVTYTITDKCYETTTRTRTFEVTPAPAVVVGAPANSSANACTYANQDAVNTAFAAWLAQFTVSGGCDPSGNYGEVSAPNACGGLTTVTYTVTDKCYETTTRTRTFEVTPAPAVVVGAPANSSANACTYANQDEVSNAFAAWLAQFTVSGGCDPSGSYGEVSAPLACGGLTTVTYTVTDKCYETTTRTRTFEVTPAPAVVVGAPANSSASACTYANQDEVSNAFAAWLAQFTVSGGCDPSGNYGEVSAPNACGGLTTVTYTVTDKCYETTTRTRTFEVTPAPAVVVGAPANSSANACTYANQDAVNTAFAAWLAQFTVSGGCSPSGNYGQVSAPNACGGLTTVTYTVTDKCYQTTTRTRTFEVTPAPAVVFNCGSNVNIAACSTQAQVNAAWTAFLASTTASGGCTLGSLTNNGGSAPSACGGSKEVTWTYSVGNCGQTQSCTRTFTVAAPPAVVLTCGSDVTLPACSTQAQLTAAWNAFLSSTTATGGCNGQLTRNSCSAPSLCGGYVDVTWTYTVSTCGQQSGCGNNSNSVHCTKRFTVTAPPPVVINCGSNVTVPACSTQAQVNAAWTAFLASTTASGGCGGTLTNNGGSAPSACGGYKDVTWTYSVSNACGSYPSGCNSNGHVTCTKRFTVAAPPAVVINCGSNVTVAACSTQAQVNAAWTAFLASTTASGGCGGTLTNNGGSAPSACGGYKDVTWTYTVSNACGSYPSGCNSNGQMTCTKRFTVAAPPAVVINCGTNVTVPACSTQAQVNAAWASFLASTTASGGCGGTLTNNGGSAPSACGGYKDVTWTYTVSNACGTYPTGCNSNGQMTCTKRFTVASTPAIVFNCGNNVTVPACSTQAQVTAAWNSFLASTTASGGCNGVLTRTSCSAPSACGGYVDVTWTYTVSNACGSYPTGCNSNGQMTCTKRFTVASTPAVVFNCGSNVTVPACSTQAQVNTAWASFLASTTASGGCNGVLTRTSCSAPSACGGYVDVTWTYTVSNACGSYPTGCNSNGQMTCTKRFTVATAPAVVMNCGNNVTVPACSTQAQVNAAWATFLASTTASGGCGGTLTNNGGSAPSACGGYKDVTWTYAVSNACGTYPSGCNSNGQVTCTKRFTVASTPAVVFNCGNNVTVPACSTQAQVNAAWTAFLASTTASGGCNGVLTRTSCSAPSACGGYVDVTWTYTVSNTCGSYPTGCNSNGQMTCTKRFTVASAPAVVMNCGNNVTVPACSTQAQVNAAWAAFLCSTTASGGCGGTLTNNGGSAPSACGGYKDVTWTYTVSNACGSYPTGCNSNGQVTCTKRFTVASTPAVVLNCGNNVTRSTCDSQSQINAAWSAFLCSTTASGGCSGSLTNNAPSCAPAAGRCGYVDVTWTYTASSVCGTVPSGCNSNGQVTCTKRFTISNGSTKEGVIKDELVAKTSLAVTAYPNPYSENFNLSLTTSSIEKVGLSVYDMTGKLIEQREVSATEVGELQVGNSYPSGVYNVIVTQGSDVKTLRVIKR